MQERRMEREPFAINLPNVGSLFCARRGSSSVHVAPSRPRTRTRGLERDDMFYFVWRNAYAFPNGVIIARGERNEKLETGDWRLEIGDYGAGSIVNCSNVAAMYGSVINEALNT